MQRAETERCKGQRKTIIIIIIIVITIIIIIIIYTITDKALKTKTKQAKKANNIWISAESTVHPCLRLAQHLPKHVHFLPKFPYDPSIGIFIDNSVIDDTLGSICVT